jgi:acetate kinase
VGTDLTVASDILCLNAGSSSLKFAVYRIGDASEERLLSGEAEGIGSGRGKFWVKERDNPSKAERAQEFSCHGDAVAAMFEALQKHGVRDPAAAGHRIVHGGSSFFDPQKIDAQVVARLKDLIPLAPLHLPSQISIIEDLGTRRAGLVQVACFDTAFHQRMPEVARRFALPRSLWDQGVRRYGFHGISYEFVVQKLGNDLGSRAIIAHLGNGASMVALKDGVPVDTSMGLTPTGGFIMGTRSGDLDPGVLLYLLRQGWSPERLETLLDRESGLAGVSGLTSDMRALLERGATDANAAQAVAMFCYQVRKFIGAYAAALGGLETLVFTGGIGERAAIVRSRIVEGLKHLGIVLDEKKNSAHAAVISVPESPCAVRVVETDEDLMIARHTSHELSRLSGLI